MSLSSHVTANLDLWVENGFVSAEQREAIAQLITNACIDAERAGYDSGYDEGYVDGSD